MRGRSCGGKGSESVPLIGTRDENPRQPGAAGPLDSWHSRPPLCAILFRSGGTGTSGNPQTGSTFTIKNDAGTPLTTTTLANSTVTVSHT